MKWEETFGRDGAASRDWIEEATRRCEGSFWGSIDEKGERPRGVPRILFAATMTTTTTTNEARRDLDFGSNGRIG